jgi:hypothetical protein
MPTTPVLALPYPNATDTADVPRDIQALAVKLDGYTSLRPPAVTSLPGSPVDTQECYFVADATNAIVWHLRYRSAATGAYKWEYLGGSPLASDVVATEAVTSATPVDLATVGPQVTVPLAGDYRAQLGFSGYSGSAGVNVNGGLKIGAAAATTDVSFQTSAANAGQQPIRDMTVNIATAGTVVKIQYSNSAAASYRWRFLTLRPVRVG